MEFAKNIILLLFFITSCACVPQASSEQEFVREFYTWYGSELLRPQNGYPLNNDNIYRYVSKHTVDRLRTEYSASYVGFDYFIKANDFWPDLLESMAFENPIILPEKSVIVPLVFTAGLKKHVIHVFLVNDHDSFSIVKVEDAPG